MSRIGKRPIAIPKGVQVHCKERKVHVKGPKGEMNFDLPVKVELEVKPEELQLVADYKNDRDARCQMGTANAILSNMVTGVSTGFSRKLMLVGVGYRAAVAGTNLELSLGYSHPVVYKLPAQVKAQMNGNTEIVLTSYDKVALGQAAANIRSLRPPEPYLGKGISYEGERIRRKAGKAGKK